MANNGRHLPWDTKSYSIDEKIQQYERFHPSTSKTLDPVSLNSAFRTKSIKSTTKASIQASIQASTESNHEDTTESNNESNKVLSTRAKELVEQKRIVEKHIPAPPNMPPPENVRVVAKGEESQIQKLKSMVEVGEHQRQRLMIDMFKMSSEHAVLERQVESSRTISLLMEKLETERNQFQAFQLKYHQEKQEWLGKIEQESRGRQKAMEERQAVFEYASGIERRLHSCQYQRALQVCNQVLVTNCRAALRFAFSKLAVRAQ